MMDGVTIPPWSRVAAAMFVVGWGANQFTPLLLVYRSTDHFSQTLVTAMFAAYAGGLVPALLVAARLAGRFGHRAVLRPVLVLAAVASLLLAVGESTPALLFIGRVMYGVCTGAAMAPGTTWVKELSADRPIGTGARRAAVALSAGFGGGPLVAGLMAQWLPAPKILPYVVHIALIVVAGVLVWNAPEPGRRATQGRRGAEEQREATTGTGSMQSELASAASRAGREEPSKRHSGGASRGAVSQHYVLSGHFWTRIAPMAAWVFACPSISMVVLPPLIKDQTGEFTVGFTAIVCGLTLAVGVLVQQPARSLETRRPGTVSLLGMVGALVGVLLTVAVVDHPSIVLVILTAVVFGVGYGLTLVGGLTRVEHASPASELAMSNAVFYSLTYLGFALPTIISMLAGTWPERSIVLGLAALAMLSLVAATRAQHAARALAV